jgi:hypothetical protein
MRRTDRVVNRHRSVPQDRQDFGVKLAAVQQEDDHRHPDRKCQREKNHSTAENDM